MNDLLTMLLIVCEELGYTIMSFSIYDAEHETSVAIIENENGELVTIKYDEENNDWR